MKAISHELTCWNEIYITNALVLIFDGRIANSQIQLYILQGKYAQWWNMRLARQILVLGAGAMLASALFTQSCKKDIYYEIEMRAKRHADTTQYKDSVVPKLPDSCYFQFKYRKPKAEGRMDSIKAPPSDSIVVPMKPKPIVSSENEE